MRRRCVALFGGALVSYLHVILDMAIIKAAAHNRTKTHVGMSLPVAFCWRALGGWKAVQRGLEVGCKSFGRSGPVVERQSRSYPA